MSDKIDRVLAEEGASAENYELPDELPEGAEVSRPNLGKAIVVSVRLSGEEHGRLRRAAEAANLPVSTLMRLWVLDRLSAEERRSGASVAERLNRLEKAVFRADAQLEPRSA